MSVNIDISVKKCNKVYHEGEIIAGTIIVDSNNAIKHDGIMLMMEGVANLQLSQNNVGLLDAFYNTARVVKICQSTVEISGPGKLPKGHTELPFEIPLVTKSNKPIWETYHGVYITVQYTLKCDIKRGLLAKDINKIAEFIVEYRDDKCEKAIKKPLPFTIIPDTIKSENIENIPKFKICGKIDSIMCPITSPFKGDLMIMYSDIPIKSIELQLVRVETCGCEEGFARDEFEVNLVILFENDHLISENIPIVLTRS